MQYQQLELDLWQELESAAAVPQSADLKQLCHLLEQAVAQLPQPQQLAAAAEAIEQLVEIYARRADWLIATWKEAYAEPDAALPVLSAERLNAWVRQTMSVDLDAFVQKPTKRQQQKQPLPSPTNSVASLVEKQTLLEAFASQIRAADSTEQYVDASVELENTSQWTSAISQWMQQCGTEKVSLFGLQQALGMPLVEVWLGLLLSKEHSYEWEKSGDFYDDATKVWISSTHF